VFLLIVTTTIYSIKKNEKCLFDYCTIVENNPFFYLFAIFCFLSFLITIGMMIYGCIICCCHSKKNNDLPDKNQKIDDDEEEEDII